jgi:hypothetical protein
MRCTISASQPSAPPACEFADHLAEGGALAPTAQNPDSDVVFLAWFIGQSNEESNGSPLARLLLSYAPSFASPGRDHETRRSPCGHRLRSACALHHRL